MPLFQYKAIAQDGKRFKGVIDADSFTTAKERLRREKIFVTSVSLLQLEGKKVILTPFQLLAFTRELAQLLKAGLPLYESLLTLEEKQRGSKTHPLFADLCDKLKSGVSFSAALSCYPGVFGEVYLSMIRSSEESSSLTDAFEQLAFLITKQQKLKKQLFSTLAYPAFLATFCLLVVGVLFFFVIPSMKDLFADRSLHPVTQIVMGVSDFLNRYWCIIGLGFGFLTGAAYAMSKTLYFQRKFNEKLLQLPYCKKIILQSAFVRFFRAMTMLLSGGIPLVDSLRFAKKMVGNKILVELVEETELKMVEGKKISHVFAQSFFIPPLVVRMLAIGEETGNMLSVMRSLAEIYEEDLDKDLQQLVTFLQPAILLLLGAIVGLVVLSILLPLTDVGSFMSS